MDLCMLHGVFGMEFFCRFSSVFKLVEGESKATTTTITNE